MTCLVLAAGYATRLYPLTENFPKALLPVGGISILDRLLENVAESGMVQHYAVITNAKYAKNFHEWSKTAPYNVTIIDNNTTTNETRLGAVRDMQYAAEQLKTRGDMLVMAGDNLLDFPLATFLNYAQQKKTSCVMRYHEPNPEACKKSGVLQTDAHDRITDMQEKPPAPLSQWLCPPFYYLTQQDLHLIPKAIADGCATDAPGSFIAWLHKHSPIHAMPMPGNRHDIGDLPSYERVKDVIK
jgi:glucose-1-phosphate thymidylyltransferase